MRRALWAALAALFICAGVEAQGTRFTDTALKPTAAIPGATVRVCTETASGTPCAPLASIYSDKALTVLDADSTITADALGNFGFYAAPGCYKWQVSAPGYSTTTEVVCNSEVDGAAIAPANLNNILFVDGVKYATIDAAVAALGGNAGTVIIPSNYAGAESSNLVDMGGYMVYAGVANVTIIDYRSVATAPGNIYPISHGGRTAGQLSRFGVSGVWASPSDSAVGSASFGWFSGAFPSNNGELMGGVAVGATRGTITVGASISVLAGFDSEVNLMHTVGDGPIPYVAGYTGAVHIPRTTTPTGATTGAAYSAQAATNISAAGATFVNVYGFDAAAQTVGTARNYSYHSHGNWLTEVNTSFDFVDAGGTIRKALFFRSSNSSIELLPYLDSVGWLFNKNSGGTVVQIKDGGLYVAGTVGPIVAAGSFLGGTSLPFAGLYIGNAVNNTAALAGTFTANRNITVPDASGAMIVDGAAQTVNIKRLKASGGTALVAGDFALSAGCGSTASVSAVASNSRDQTFEFSLASAGTGQGANTCTATLTFKDGTFTNAPFLTCQRNDILATAGRIAHTTLSATAPVLTFVGTPVATETYKVACNFLGN